MNRILLRRTFERTIDAWVAEASRVPRPRRLEAWVFEGEHVRQEAERRLQAFGIEARVRSAYKPLLHHVLEEVDRAGLSSVLVRYPVLPGLVPDRFRLEAYPLHELLPGVDLRFEPVDATPGQPACELVLHGPDGRPRTDRVPVPTRFHPDPDGRPQASPTAWRRTTLPDGSVREGPEPSDYAAVVEAALELLRTHPWPASEPFFGRLRIDVTLPTQEPSDRAAPYADLLEAMHEELYFSALEHFQRHTGRPAGDRHLRPGQIAPFVRPGEQVTLCIALEDVGSTQPASAPTIVEPPSLATAEHPLSPSRIAQELAGLGGTRFEAATAQGRRTIALHLRGALKPVLVSGGQHANETSGVVGALRAVAELRERGLGFALIALENPDGYALHQELCEIAPTQMHHAARYSALGDDIGHREQPPLGERAARHWALAQSGAALHINLHGYPAHEWTRPLSGYLPSGFEDWTIPKGFFLIVRHHAGWQRQARALIGAVCATLARHAELRAFNARQIDACRRYRSRPLPFELIDGFLCSISEAADGPPLTVTTEFPDQTLQGPAFAFAHEVQRAAVIAAVDAYHALCPSWTDPGVT